MLLFFFYVKVEYQVFMGYSAVSSTVLSKDYKNPGMLADVSVSKGWFGGVFWRVEWTSIKWHST